MTWFKRLAGFHENTPDAVREMLSVEGTTLRSLVNDKSWVCGELEVLNLMSWRRLAQSVAPAPTPISVREVVANVQHLHQDEANAGALFQVASQFNLLEMVSPRVTPEDGIGIYENDFTQGPACAIACGAGTIYRNYFANVNGQIGQSAKNQIDCLAGVGELLGNADEKLWKMVNGYALPSVAGLQEVNRQLADRNEQQLNELRRALEIGLQKNTQVTLGDATHTVSQVYCSAMPVAYTSLDSQLWAPFAQLILEAAYEATICAGMMNATLTGNNRVYLTLLGGGAFGNQPSWILAAIRRSLKLYSHAGLEVIIVSYGRSNPAVQSLASEFS